MPDRNKQNTIFFIYNSFKDPLFQNLMYRYILDVKGQVDGKFHIITFEQKRHEVSRPEREKIQNDLSEKNIYWHPISYHTGKFLLLYKAFDLLLAFTKVIKLRLQGVSTIFCFANVSFSFGYILSRVLKMRLNVYSFEPHGDFLIDFGYWKKHQLKYRVLNWIEWRAGLVADVVITGTKWMQQTLIEKGSKAKVYWGPTAVDDKLFQFDTELREIIRKKNNWGNYKILVYAGKFGGLYYSDETFLFVRKMMDQFENLHFLILTQDDHEEIEDLANRFLSKKQYTLTTANNYKEMVGFLSASDIGLNTIPPLPSQKFRSPTKIAEYLMTGLPYITCKGVSEDDIYANKHRVGCVVDDFHKELTIEFCDRFRELMTEEKEVQVKRIRNIGIQYRSKVRIDNIFKEVFNVN